MSKPNEFKSVRVYLATHETIVRLSDKREQDHAVIMKNAVECYERQLDMEVGGAGTRQLKTKAGKPAKRLSPPSGAA